MRSTPRVEPARPLPSEDHFRAVFDSTPVALVTVGPDLAIVDANLAARHLLGRSGERVEGSHLGEAVRSLDSGDETVVTQVLRGERDGFCIDRADFDAAGHRVWLRISGHASDSTSEAMAVLSIEDVTADRLERGRLEHLAHHDALTGLVNRVFALEHLRRAQARSARNDQHLAVVFIDLDDFKALNDSHGHSVGDTALIEIAARISGSVRPADTVARLSGDEFIVICEDLGVGSATARDEVLDISSRIITAIGEPFSGIRPATRVGASIGVALTRGEPVPSSHLLGRADQAMYEAKSAGGNCSHLADLGPSSLIGTASAE